MSKAVGKAAPIPKGKAAIAKAVDRVWDIPLSRVDLDGKNHRVPRPDDEAKIAELVESFKIKGQQTPGLVYEVPGKNYVIAYGHRRFEAAKRAGIPVFKALIRPLPKDRSEVEADRLIENITQHKLTPIDEMVGVNQLLDSLGAAKELEKAVMETAKRLGKGVDWVRDRLYFNRLTPQVREWVIAGRIPIPHAKELAKIGGAEQTKLAEWCALYTEDGSGNICSVDTLRSRIAASFRSLKMVPWRLDNAFKGVEGVCGACTGCRFNSSTDGNLFADKNKPEDNTCLHDTCYARKQAVCEEKRATLGSRMAKMKLSGEKAAENLTVKNAPFLKPASVARVASKLSASPDKRPDIKPRESEEDKYSRLVREGNQKFWNAMQGFNDAAIKSIFKAAAKTPGHLLALKLLLPTLMGVPDKALDNADSQIAVFFSKTAWGKDIDKIEKLMKLPGGIEHWGALERRGRVYSILAKFLKAEIGKAPVQETFLPKKPEEKMADKLKVKADKKD